MIESQLDSLGNKRGGGSGRPRCDGRLAVAVQMPPFSSQSGGRVVRYLSTRSAFRHMLEVLKMMSNGRNAADAPYVPCNELNTVVRRRSLGPVKHRNVQQD